jgi:peptidoglycan/LPS O-acetylase OafA/YrhL
MSRQGGRPPASLRLTPRTAEAVTVSPTTRSGNRGLDVVRGAAAILVVLGHSRELLFTAQGLPVSGKGGFEKLLLAPTSLAQESVAVFFVLSGYLVGGQVVRQVRANRFSWPVYLANRLRACANR